METNLEKTNHSYNLFSSRNEYTIKQSWDAKLEFRIARSIAIIRQDWRENAIQYLRQFQDTSHFQKVSYL